jgi:high affinity sulfate transporter 1
MTPQAPEGRKAQAGDQRAWLRYTPGLASMASYQAEWLRYDVVAGIVLAAMLVPAGMAYAELAGLQPIYGLYASVVPMLAYAVFGPSRVLVVGPDSSTAPLVAAAIVPLALADPAQRLALAGMLALMVGVIALIIGVAKLGLVTDLLSQPVRIGYMNGLAIIILVSQLPKLFGFQATADHVVPRVAEFSRNLPHANPAALAIGLVALVTIVVLRWLAPRIPGMLVAAVMATVLSIVLTLPARYGVPVVGSMPSGLPGFHIPLIPIADFVPMLAAAVGIAVMTLTDTAVMSRVFAARMKQDVDIDQELAAVGAANVAAGLFAGFPVSGSQTRTAVAADSGSRSQLAGLVAAVLVGVLLVAAPDLLAPLPQSVLAAIVIVAGFSLADVPGLIRLWGWRKMEFALATATLLGVVLLGVLPGVGVAVVLSLLNFVRREWIPHDAVLGRAKGMKGYHDVSDVTEAVQVPGLLLYRFDAPLFFANGEMFRRRVLKLVDEADPPVRWVVIAAEPITDIDTTAVTSLLQLMKELHERGVELGFAELKHPVRDDLRAYGVFDEIGEDGLYPTIGAAVKAYVRSTGADWVDWQHDQD